MWFARFILGTFFGSFLNVLAVRYDPDRFLFSKKIIGGRSHCSHCGTTLKFFELVPLLSFVALRGRCRHCHARLSFQYPFAELIAGLIMAFVPARLEAFYGALGRSHAMLDVVWVTFFFALLVMALIDLRLRIIPDEITVLVGILALVLIVITPVQFWMTHGSFLGPYYIMLGAHGNIWVNHIAASLIAGIFFGSLIFITKGRGMGMGDLKLAMAFGLIFGWPDIALVLCLSFIIGSIVGVGMLMAHATKLKSAIPFGPFLALGVATAFFYGEPMVRFYFSLFR